MKEKEEEIETKRRKKNKLSKERKVIQTRRERMDERREGGKVEIKTEI